MVSFPGFTIQTLVGDAGDFHLYTALRDADALSVILKIPMSPRPSSAEERLLEHEMDIARQLDPSLVSHPIGLVRTEGKVALVFKKENWKPLAAETGTPMEIERFLKIAIRAASALAEIHRHDFIHKDIKPQYLLIDPVYGDLRVTGFGIASQVPRESQAAQPPNLLEGTLAYMSPEQTGRMNRALDYRTDFYSLGVTFYQLLTGRLPFQAADPLEWIHCHIARFPKSPSAMLPNIPEPLSEIVMKLLAKVAEDRYQNALGLRRDLEHCLKEWMALRQIQPFPLGRGDLSERFQIPQKLYGREVEIAKLMAAFERVSLPELLLVSGYPGIGKSTLVQELHKPVVFRRGFFISGKFDQVQRDTPYSTLLLALDQLIHQILSESQERIDTWKTQLLTALNGNGRLIIDLIPDLEWIIGPQPPVPELPFTQAQNRLHRTVQNFLSVFARQEHPLVFFLDDLQWIDSASLLLLRYLLTSPETRHILFVGAYRDNEVPSSHPLTLALEEIRRSGTPITSIGLGPLALAETNQLVADTLHCDLRHAAPLAKLVHEKTGSNPFFVIQFLITLFQEKLISFNHGQAVWQWNIERIQEHGYTDNVVEFMIAKIGRLSTVTRQVMQLAACIGHEGSLSTLALICGLSEKDAEQELLDAAREGLVLLAGSRYRFLHDRVQQAAYALIAPKRRPEIHLQIARILLSNATNRQTVDEEIFEIVNQLNFGAELMRNKEERLQAAQLNLAAGRRAQASTAYTSALIYYAAGISLLDEAAWAIRPELSFQLYFGQAQCEHIAGHSDESLSHLETLLPHASTDLQRAEIYRTEVDIYTQKTDLAKAVERGLEGLRLFGIAISPHPTREQGLAAYDEVWRNLGNRPIEELADLPLMTDAGMHAAMRILEALYTSALCTNENLFISWASHMVNLSMKYGNCDASVTAYSYFGMALGSLFGRYREGYLFGKLGHDLVEKHGIAAYRPKVHFIFGECINYLHRHLRENMEALQLAFLTAVEVADVTTACYCCNHRAINLLVLGEPLETVHREAQHLMQFTQKAPLDASTQTIVGIDRMVQTMRGKTASFSTFSDAGFDEAAYDRFMDGYRQPIVTCWYYVMKLQARFMSHDYEEAIAAAHKAQPILWASMGHTQESEFLYYYPLALAACYERFSPGEQRKALETMHSHQQKLRELAGICPANFQNKSALLDAEISRIEGKPMKEITAFYEQAIQSARQNSFIQNEGIANELAGRYFGALGFENIARSFLREARSCYQQWGAAGKVRHLETLHPWLREIRSPEFDTTISAPFEKLDMMTVSKAQQAISGELRVDRLVETLLRIVLEHAGAQKSFLFMEPEGEVFSVIHSSGHENDVRFHRMPLAMTKDAAISMVNYVKRTRETVILADASINSGDFLADPYLQRAQPKSVLCMPVVRQTKLSGVLYLENNLLTNAFTPDRRAVLELLASQAAISLETALLYSDLQQSKDEQQNQADILRLILDSMGEGVLVMDEWTEIILANPMALELIGANTILIPTDDWAEKIGLYRPDQTTLYLPHELPLNRALQGEPSDSMEMFMKRPGSSQGRWLEVSARPLIDKAGKVSGAVAVFSDITSRIEAARNEREAKESAQAANRTKDQFLAMLSHELRTPLTPVLNGINNLEEMTTRKSRPILEIMRRNLLLEMRLIDDLLDVTGIAKGKLTIHSEPVDAIQALRNAVETCQPQLEARQLKLSLEAREPYVNADAGRLQQIVRNLIQNAVRFTKAGGKIELRAFNPTPGTFRIVCRDNGVGIEPGDLTRIFKPFEQSKRIVERGYGGLGLGLAIAKALTEAQGGTIEVQSTGRGTGAAFEITFPTLSSQALQALPGKPGVETQDLRDGSSKNSHLPPRILLVEDHGDTRRTLERLLTRAGYHVEGASDCHGALKLEKKHPFDVIVCDIGLPDGNGYDLIRTLRQHREVPAISLSGFGMESDFERSRSAGFAQHLVKPIDFKNLKATIERLR